MVALNLEINKHEGSAVRHLLALEYLEQHVGERRVHKEEHNDEGEHDFTVKLAPAGVVPCGLELVEGHRKIAAQCFRR